MESAPILPIPHGDVFRISQAFAEIRREFEMADALAAKSLRAWLQILFARTMPFIPSSARWSSYPPVPGWCASFTWPSKGISGRNARSKFTRANWA